jgi:hypothetical protein
MKTKTNKISTAIIYFIIVLCGFCYFNSAAQTADSSWISAKDTLGVSIHYKFMACNGRNWLFLKATNSTGNAVTLKWDDVLTSGSANYSSVAKPNFNGAIHLAANQTKEGSCAAPYGNDRALSIPLKSFIGDVAPEQVNYSVLNVSVQ